MSFGVTQRVGSFTGTGSAITLDGDKIGFRPKYIKLVNVTGLVELEWFEHMADDSGLKTLNHDTAQKALITSDGITPTATGFTVGADSDVNASGEIVHYLVVG